MTDQTTPKVKNYTPATGVFVDDEDQIIDLKTLFTSGDIVVTSAPAPEDDPSIIGTATTPKIANRTPLTGVFVDYLNQLIDFKTLLTSGLIKVQLSGNIGLLADQSYVTLDDNRDVLPNSSPLALQDDGFLSVQNGTGLIRTRVFDGFVNEIVVTDGDGIADNPRISLSDTLVLPGTLTSNDNVILNGPYLQIAHEILLNSSGAAIRATTGNKVSIESTDINTPIDLVGNYVAVQSAICRRVTNGIYQLDNNITFGNATQDFKIGGNSILNISADGLLAGGNVNLNGYQITSQSGQDIIIAPGGPLDWIELAADTVNVQKSLIFDSVTTDNITHNTAQNALYFNLANTNVVKLSSDGLKLANGATIDTIDNSGVSFSQTAGATCYAIQQMISAAIDAGVSFRTVWDASGGTFPATGGSGSGGAIEKGNWWYISVAGTLAGQDVNPGDWITAIVDTPGQTGSNWLVSYQGVTNVFGRLGEIVATFGDYSFSLISGNIATSQLPNSGVNGASQLVQLNASTQLPAVSGVNLTGLTGSLSSSANNLNVSVNGGTASSNVSIINTNVLGVSGTNISSTINGVASNNISVGFSNLTGTIATTQLPGGGVNGASQLVQLNASTQLPAVSGVNLTGLTGTLTSTANNLSVSVNGGTSSANVNIINSNSLSSTANSMTSAVNGVSSSANIINSNSLSSSANSLTSTVNGIASPTANIVNSISLGLSGTALTATVNGITSGSVSVQPANSFVVASSSTQAMAVNTTYYQTYAGQCVYTLPTTAVVDSFVKVISGPANTFKVGQNAGQLTYAPSLNGVSQVTTTGVGGYTYSTDPNTVTIYRCVVADTTWVIESTTSMIGGV